MSIEALKGDLFHAWFDCILSGNTFFENRDFLKGIRCTESEMAALRKSFSDFLPCSNFQIHRERDGDPECGIKSICFEYDFQSELALFLREEVESDTATDKPRIEWIESSCEFEDSSEIWGVSAKRDTFLRLLKEEIWHFTNSTHFHISVSQHDRIRNRYVISWWRSNLNNNQHLKLEEIVNTSICENIVHSDPGLAAGKICTRQADTYGPVYIPMNNNNKSRASQKHPVTVQLKQEIVEVFVHAGFRIFTNHIKISFQWTAQEVVTFKTELSRYQRWRDSVFFPNIWSGLLFSKNPDPQAPDGLMRYTYEIAHKWTEPIIVWQMQQFAYLSGGFFEISIHKFAENRLTINFVYPTDGPMNTAIKNGFEIWAAQMFASEIMLKTRDNFLFPNTNPYTRALIKWIQSNKEQFKAFIPSSSSSESEFLIFVIEEPQLFRFFWYEYPKKSNVKVTFF